jgi:hypothetical protein
MFENSVYNLLPSFAGICVHKLHHLRVVVAADCGGKTAREMAEQLMLDSFNGPSGANVLNKINPIGLARQALMGEGYVRP